MGILYFGVLVGWGSGRKGMKLVLRGITERDCRSRLLSRKPWPVSHALLERLLDS